MAFVAVSEAAAAISVGQIAGRPSDVAAYQCDVGTFAVTSTGMPPRYEIPGDGVITSWRTYTGAKGGQGPVRLKVIRPVSASSFKVVGASKYINPAYDFANNTGANGPFATRIPVVANDLIALGVGPRKGVQTMPFCLFNNGLIAQAQARSGADDPPSAASVLTWNASPLTYAADRVEISASLEPDLDHDGFGDETQDRCLGVAGPQNGCPQSSTGWR